MISFVYFLEAYNYYYIGSVAIIIRKLTFLYIIFFFYNRFYYNYNYMLFLCFNIFPYIVKLRFQINSVHDSPPPNNYSNCGAMQCLWFSQFTVLYIIILLHYAILYIVMIMST